MSARRSVAAVLAACALQAAAAPAHEHGVARLDVAVEAGRITLLLEMPLDTLGSSERAPRSDAERAALAAALRRLRDAGARLRIDPAAGCQAPRVEVTPPPATNDGHADVDATIVVDCSDAARAGFVDLPLFTAFPRLQRIDLQIAGPRGQAGGVLKRPTARLALPPR